MGLALKNDQQYAGYYRMLWHFCTTRMPLLFLIWCRNILSLGKRTSAQYLGERFKRLFIPIMVGVLLCTRTGIY
ncbi:MAG: hypothetical protein IPH69_01790 [Bacteroidales bacterium]|nr:hypothetical protein [Bacteroidales bacterium]